MKYCTNCKENKKSWAEHYGDYSKYSDNQCWSCDKYTLTNNVSSRELVATSTSTALSSMQSGLNVDKVEKGIGKVENNKIRGFEETAKDYNRQTKEYKAEILQYSKDRVHYESTREW